MFGAQCLGTIFAAIQAYPEVKNGDFSSLGVIVFLVLCASVIVSVVIAIIGVSKSRNLTPHPHHPTPLAPTAPQSDSELSIRYERETISVTLGSRVRIPWKLNGEATLLLKEIKSEVFDEYSVAEPCVYVEIQGVVALHHGTDAKMTANKEYVLFPIVSGRYEVDSSLWDRSATEKFFSFASLMLEHVNPHTGVAEFESLIVNVYKR